MAELSNDPWDAVRSELVLAICRFMGDYLESTPTVRKMPMRDVTNAMVLGVPLEILARVMVNPDVSNHMKTAQVYSTARHAKILYESAMEMIVVIEAQGLDVLLAQLEERQREYLENLLPPTPLKEM